MLNPITALEKAVFTFAPIDWAGRSDGHLGRDGYLEVFDMDDGCARQIHFNIALGGVADEGFFNFNRNRAGERQKPSEMGRKAYHIADYMRLQVKLQTPRYVVTGVVFFHRAALGMLGCQLKLFQNGWRFSLDRSVYFHTEYEDTRISA